MVTYRNRLCYYGVGAEEYVLANLDFAVMPINPPSLVEREVMCQYHTAVGNVGIVTYLNKFGMGSVPSDVFTYEIDMPFCN